MAIQHISRKNLSNTIKSDYKFKSGQIVQGKILKLYPDNKAQIKIGSKVLTAQLKVSLSLHESYIFQVENSSDLLQLKVIADETNGQRNVNTSDLIKSLGLKASKDNVALMQQLISDQVPFDKKQLAESFRFLDGVQDKEAGKQIIKEMLLQKLPLTDSIFNALLTKNTTELSAHMTELLKELLTHQNPTELTQNIIKQLTEMSTPTLNPKNEMIVQILSEIASNKQDIFMTLKTAGIIKSDIDFSTWKAEWQSFVQQNNITSLTVSNQQLNQLNPPFIMDENTLSDMLSVMQANKVPLQNEAQSFINKWSKSINQAFINNISLTTSNFTELKAEVTERILPLLPQAQRNEVMKLLENNPASLRYLLQSIQPLIADSIYSKSEEVLSMLSQGGKDVSQLPKEQFLAHLNQMLMNSGITDENILAQKTLDAPINLKVWADSISDAAVREMQLSSQESATLKQEVTERLLPLLTDSQKVSLMKLMSQNPLQLTQLSETIQMLIAETIESQDSNLKDSMSLKSMLIQSMNQTDSISSERTQQLLHFINGMQLQSVNESNNFIQASIQLPGEKLNLNKDLYIDFESKKTEDGNINTDFCRIMFYLDLENLEETVIDMNIQNRLVSVTIFSNEEQMPKEFKALQPLLKSGLSELDYQLSRVTIKPLSNMENQKITQQKDRRNASEKVNEGMDFQV